jgi:RNA polymerase sigma-70 factor, ECF subfamily
LDYTALDDAALIDRIARVYGGRASDPELNNAVAELYDRYGRLVFSIAIRVVGDVETAEEITQDVFVRACEAAHVFRPETARMSSWLVSIARNRAVDELRRRSTRHENERVDWPEDIEQESAEGMPVSDGPETQVETNLAHHGLRKIITTLPFEQRRVLGLAFFRGLSQSEIAALLGEPLGTVKSRIRIAMQKLRDILTENNALDRY